jgi:hypothetical protein
MTSPSVLSARRRRKVAFTALKTAEAALEAVAILSKLAASSPTMCATRKAYP